MAETPLPAPRSAKIRWHWPIPAPEAESAPRRRLPRLRGNWLVAGLYGAAGLFALLSLLGPLYLVIRTGSAWREALATIARLSTLQIVGNTALLVVSVTLASAALAVPLAWLTARSDLPGRRLWSVLHALPLVIPSYIYAYLFASFLSPKGLLQQLMEGPLGVERLPSLYGFGGAFLVLTLISYPFIFLTVQAALRHMDPTLLEVAQTNGASKRQIARHVLWPYLRPSILAGGMLVALYTLRDFGAVTLLQFSTFTRVIYNRYLGFQLDQAATMAVLLMILIGLVMWTESRLRGDDGTDETLDISECAREKRLALGRWRGPALLLNGAVTLLALVLPVGVLVYWIGRGLSQGAPLAQANNFALSEAVTPLWSSFGVALLAAFLAALLALPIAILSVRHNNRVTRAVERVSYSGYALPGIVIALAFVFAGINIARPLYQTMPMLLAAYMVLFVPLAVAAERGVLARIPRELEEVGYSLGGSHLQILRHVTLPLLRPGLLAAGALVFLTALKELPATLLLSPLGLRTLPMLVWSNINEAFFVRAAVPALFLLLLSSLPLAWITLRDNRSS